MAKTYPRKKEYIPSHERPGFDESKVIHVPTDWKMKPLSGDVWSHSLTAKERLNAQVFTKNESRRQK